MTDLIRIADELGALTLDESAQLIGVLRERWDVLPVSFADSLEMSNRLSEVGVEAVEQDEVSGHSYDVVLTSVGENRIKVIKLIREFTGWGLYDAKDFIAGVPVNVRNDLLLDEANEMCSRFIEVGAGAVVQIEARHPYA